MRATLITAPAAEPLTLAQAKLYLKVDASDDDTLLMEQIRTSRQWCEAFTRRALISQVWDFGLERFPVGEIRLPHGKASKIHWIKYTDPAGVEQTLTGPTSDTPGSGYQEDLSDSYGGILCPAYGSCWPAVREVLTPVRVRATVGYGDTAADIPGQLVDAIRYRLASIYESRGEQDGGKGWEGVAEAMARPFEIAWFGP